MTNNTLGLILSFSYVVLVVLAATILQKLKLLGEEGSRKFIHIGVANCWMILMIFFDNMWLACIPPLVFVVANYLSYKFNLVKSMERHKGGSLGTIYYPIALICLVLLTFWFHKTYLGAVGALILGYGDGLAGLIGKKYGRSRLFGEKTVAGTLTMFIASLIVSLIVLSIFTPTIALPGSILIALGASTIELFTPLDIDNLTVPIGSTLLYYLLILIGSAAVMNLFVAVILNIIIAWIAYYKHALDFSGIVAAFIIGLTIYVSAGPLMWLLLVVFLVSSSLITHFRKDRKTRLSTDYKKSCRNYKQVVAKGSIAFLLSIIYFFTNSNLFFILAVASIAVSCADTWGSEIGPFSKGKTISITTFRRVKKGTPGGISLLGTIASLLGASLIAGLLILKLIFLPNFHPVQIAITITVVAFSGLLGGLADSFLGATLHTRPNVSNEFINFASNLFGVVFAWIMLIVF